MTYPANAVCDVENCGHHFSVHNGYDCMLCDEHAGFKDVAPAHAFKPRRLAGGALTPDEEKVAYERAMGRA